MDRRCFDSGLEFQKQHQELDRNKQEAYQEMEIEWLMQPQSPFLDTSASNFARHLSSYICHQPTQAKVVMHQLKCQPSGLST